MATWLAPTLASARKFAFKYPGAAPGFWIGGRNHRCARGEGHPSAQKSKVGFEKSKVRGRKFVSRKSFVKEGLT